MQESAYQAALDDGLPTQMAYAAAAQTAALAAEAYDLKLKAATATVRSGGAAQTEHNDAMEAALALLQQTQTPLETYLQAQSEILALEPQLVELLGSKAAAQERMNLALQQAAEDYHAATEAAKEKAEEEAKAAAALPEATDAQEQFNEVAEAGAQAAAASLGDDFVLSDVRQPDAVWVARLAALRPAPGDVPGPLYLRAPDAKLPAVKLPAA